MTKKLRIPAALTFAVIAGAAAVSVAVSCTAASPVAKVRDAAPKPDGPPCPTDGAPDFDGCV
jgi:hypothetical protein